VTLTTRTPLRHAKRYATADEARTSKAGQQEGSSAAECERCEGWHVAKPKGKPPVRVRQIGRASERADGKSSARKAGSSTSSRAEPFPPAVAAQIDARDPWCVHCGSPDGLQRHHRRGKGVGGDPRACTQCACNGARLCWLCHSWAHTEGRVEAEAEGLIISRATTQPRTESVLVHTSEDGGVRKWPLCDGTYADEQPGSVAA
jgi:hypothetical protein